MELSDLPGKILLIPHIEKIDDLSIGCVEEGHPMAVPVSRSVKSTSGVPFCLLQDILRPYGNFLRLDDAEEFPFYKEGVIGRAFAVGYSSTAWQSSEAAFKSGWCLIMDQGGVRDRSLLSTLSFLVFHSSSSDIKIPWNEYSSMI